MRILAYCDEGVSPQSLQHLMRALKQYSVTRVNRKTLADHLPSASLLVMPGGRDIPYHENLKGELNRKIRTFVEEGGRYLGLCAGGYYGSSFVEFEKGNALEVVGERELGFFPGKASGPAYGNGIFRYNSESGSRIAQLDWNGKRVGVYYNGGCLFADADSYENIEVLARYADLPDTPAAIIKCTVGKGIAILSGVHPEYMPKLTEELLEAMSAQK